MVGPKQSQKDYRWCYATMWMFFATREPTRSRDDSTNTALHESKTSVKVKARGYPIKDPKFSRLCIQSLCNLGYFKQSSKVAWKTAPCLGPMNSKSKLRTTINLRPVNAAAQSENWPISSIEAELTDSNCSAIFETLNFVQDIRRPFRTRNPTMYVESQRCKGPMYSRKNFMGSKRPLSNSSQPSCQRSHPYSKQNVRRGLMISSFMHI